MINIFLSEFNSISYNTSKYHISFTDSNFGWPCGRLFKLHPHPRIVKLRRVAALSLALSLSLVIIENI